MAVCRSTCRRQPWEAERLHAAKGGTVPQDRSARGLRRHGVGAGGYGQVSQDGTVVIGGWEAVWEVVDEEGDNKD